MTARTDGQSPWRSLLRIADALERPVVRVGEAVSWLFLPLIAIILFDALTRRYLRKLDFVMESDLHFYLNSPAMQDAEWHLHAIIMLCALGYACACNAHVRLDMLRGRLGERGRLWVEFLGGLFLLMPFMAIFAADCFDFFWIAWVHDETAGETNGIGERWVIKFFMFFGPVLLLMAGASVLIRLAVRLFGPPELAPDTRTEAISARDFSAFN
ncbi:TRAP transporter small permease subunit [Thalassobaculum sp. OXR-137]|uniref:TRAP transporter small permease subunit n=1 Tax=Thalassobaculum sp. OXR-137 TaxID=3100173 RepID=UPI002AC8F176|nr:TRAP transporter small permease subunit [Thalassobaculum sp. OXR-137]WPZ34579.1 TRAP transporter small permease subunit [Thalassobaculum sp. OXR-137]